MRPDVWAPLARRVEVVLGDRHRVELTREPSGWFRGGPTLGPGDRYGFSLDGSDPLPDPRSRWQPDGVHGLSAVDDPAAFRWSDHRWTGAEVLGGVIYEVHVGTFTTEGTLDAAIERLPHLVRLGVDAVELMPVAQAMGRRGWGYDGVDLFAVHHAYGGPAALRRFVDAAHGHGLGVLLDVVYNHLGPEGNYLDRFGPYFSDRHHTPWGQGVNLDGEGSDEVRRFIVDNALHWCGDHHIDGLRIDATHHLLDDRPVHLVAEIVAALADLGERTGVRRWSIVEREQADHLPLRPVHDGGWNVDARWGDDLHHALHARLTGERDGYYAAFGRTGDIAETLERGHLAPGEPLPPSIAPRRLVTCTQNHDQVGNRPGGERLSHLVGIGPALVAAALVLLGPGTPLLFQGEEWATTSRFPFFCDTDDPDLAEAIRNGRHAELEPLGWSAADIADPLDPDLARSATLDWHEPEHPAHREAVEWYRTLIELRRRTPEIALGTAPPRVDVDEEQGTLVMHWPSLVVVANLSDAPRALPLHGTEIVCSSAPAEAAPAGNAAPPGITVAPMSAAVLRPGPPAAPAGPSGRS